MPDEIDRANDAAQRILDAALADQAHRAQAGRELLPAGACHSCGEPVKGDALFCPVDPRFPGESCAADWQRDHDARRRNGG
jgi:hypothetical protein